MNTDLPKALRNAAVLGWLVTLSPESRATVVRAYAIYLRCPVDEINPDFVEPEDIEFIWTNYQRVIDRFVNSTL